MPGKTETLKDQIYAAVLNDIICGKYQQDQNITEKNLMKEYNVSRAPIREALVELCNEGVLKSIPCYGYKVSPLTEQDVKSVIEYRIVLECEYMRHFWHRITEEDILSLENSLNTIVSGGEEIDSLEHWDKNTSFHLLLMSFYRNEYASKSLAKALNLQKRAYAQDRWNRFHAPAFSDPADLHSLILEQLRNNDMNTAVRLLQADINNFID